MDKNKKQMIDFAIKWQEAFKEHYGGHAATACDIAIDALSKKEEYEKLKAKEEEVQLIPEGLELHCPACGYDVGDYANIPERCPSCGQKIKL